MPILNMDIYKNNGENELKNEVCLLRENNISPSLFIITDGVDEKCKTYMKSKLNYSKKIGIDVYIKVVNSVEELSAILEYAFYEGIPTILQLPCDKALVDYYNNHSIAKIHDIDGFFSYQNISEGEYDIAPATPKGCLKYILDSEGLNLNLRNKSVVIVGRGKLVGYPLAMMCMNEGATVTVINTKTEKSLRESVLRKADIVILATGHKGSVKIWELSEHKPVYVLNVGTCFDDKGKLTTELEIDYDRDNIFYTDRIGAIGVLTVMSLMENVVNFYKKLHL